MASARVSPRGWLRSRLLAGLATFWVWHEPARVTLAVLPFENLGIDPDREYLADGLAEDIIATLGQVDPEHLGVIGRTSIMRLQADDPKSLADIGRELGASTWWRARSGPRTEGCASPPG